MVYIRSVFLSEDKADTVQASDKEDTVQVPDMVGKADILQSAALQEAVLGSGPVVVGWVQEREQVF